MPLLPRQIQPCCACGYCSFPSGLDTRHSESVLLPLFILRIRPLCGPSSTASASCRRKRTPASAGLPPTMNLSSRTARPSARASLPSAPPSEGRENASPPTRASRESVPTRAARPSGRPPLGLSSGFGGAFVSWQLASGRRFAPASLRWRSVTTLDRSPLLQRLSEVLPGAREAAGKRTTWPRSRSRFLGFYYVCLRRQVPKVDDALKSHETPRPLKERFT